MILMMDVFFFSLVLGDGESGSVLVNMTNSRWTMTCYTPSGQAQAPPLDARLRRRLRAVEPKDLQGQDLQVAPRRLVRIAPEGLAGAVSAFARLGLERAATVVFQALQVALGHEILTSEAISKRFRLRNAVRTSSKTFTGGSKEMDLVRTPA